jgi:hypothetical protein
MTDRDNPDKFERRDWPSAANLLIVRHHAVTDWVVTFSVWGSK